MENQGRQRAFKFFITACVISAMYYYISENIMPPVEIDGGPRQVLGTPVRIIVVAQNDRKAKRALEAGFDELKRTGTLIGEDINKVNHEAFNRPVKVSPEFFDLLQTCLDYCELSKGAFDITVTDSNAGGYEKLILDSNNKTVRFAAAGLQLDLGEIAKGYAVDKAAEIMKRKGATGALIDAGGIIRGFGRPQRGGNWLIGIQAFSGQRSADSNTDSNEAGMVLKLKNCAAASRPDGVTIIAQRAVNAIVIASVVSAMGAQKGLDLIDSLLGVEAIIAGENGAVTKSHGADNYLN